MPTGTSAPQGRADVSPHSLTRRLLAMHLPRRHTRAEWLAVKVWVGPYVRWLATCER